MDLSNSKGILITGGTGSFGQCFIEQLLIRHPDIPRVVIFSRDEYKQWQMMEKFPPSLYPNLRFFLGDIRDLPRLSKALEGIDVVIHAAALKQVPAAEYNPMEFVKTNVLGTENVIQASLDKNVKNVITLSTDKAASPINLYGATKLCSDKLTIAANNIKGSSDISFSVVRYGNVLGSRGSVIPYFLKQAKEGFLPITHKDMTRFSISLIEGVDMVFWSIKNTLGGEIFIPKIPSYRILDVADAIGPGCEKKVIGMRPGEKVHEEMITISDTPHTIELDECYAILPADGVTKQKYVDLGNIKSTLPNGFFYNSFNNKNFLSVQDIRQLIIKYIDKDFKPYE